jgi:hypothetical protein
MNRRDIDDVIALLLVVAALIVSARWVQLEQRRANSAKVAEILRDWPKQETDFSGLVVGQITDESIRSAFAPIQRPSQD